VYTFRKPELLNNISSENESELATAQIRELKDPSLRLKTKYFENDSIKCVLRLTSQYNITNLVYGETQTDGDILLVGTRAGPIIPYKCNFALCQTAKENKK